MQVGETSEECIELYQPFPAASIVVDGEMKSLSSRLKFKNPISQIAHQVSLELFGDESYISVHWRYEYQMKGESKCRKKSLPGKGKGDTCFVIFLKKNSKHTRDYLNFGECYDCEKYLQLVRIEDVANVINNFQTMQGGSEIYLASDANNSILRHLREFVNFKTFSDSETGKKMAAQEDMETISVIEQAICAAGKKFLGTSYSTWTTTVWMLRSRIFPEFDIISGYLDHLSSAV